MLKKFIKKLSLDGNIQQISLQEKYLLHEKTKSNGFEGFYDLKELEDYENDMIKIISYYYNSGDEEKCYLSIGNLFFLKSISFQNIYILNLRLHYDEINFCYSVSINSFYECINFKTGNSEIYKIRLKQIKSIIYNYSIFLSEVYGNKKIDMQEIHNNLHQEFKIKYDALINIIDKNDISKITIDAPIYQKYYSFGTNRKERMQYFHSYSKYNELPLEIIQKTLLNYNKYEILETEFNNSQEIDDEIDQTLNILKANNKYIGLEISLNTFLEFEKKRTEYKLKIIDISKRYLICKDFIEKIVKVKKSIKDKFIIDDHLVKKIDNQFLYYGMLKDFWYIKSLLSKSMYRDVQEYIDYTIKKKSTRYTDFNFLNQDNNSKNYITKITIDMTSKYFRNRFGVDDRKRLENMKHDTFKSWQTTQLFNLINGKFSLRMIGINIDKETIGVNDKTNSLIQKSIDIDELLNNTLKYILLQDDAQLLSTEGFNALWEIAKGESEIIEFKETYQLDTETNNKNKSRIYDVCKAICAMSNTRGGNIYVGVNDYGEIIGIKRDLIHFKSEDELLRNISQKVSEIIGPTISSSLIREIIKIGDKKILRIKVEKSDSPTFCKNVDGKNLLYYRDGPQSPYMQDAKDFYNYIVKNFKNKS